MTEDQDAISTRIRTTIVCLPVRDLEKTLAFYQNALGCSDAQIDDGIILLELPNLSLFLMGKDAFESYSKKAGRGAQFPSDGAGMVISCAMESKDAVDSVLESAPKARWGGTQQSGRRRHVGRIHRLRF